ncbi:MAG: hypothetical protein ACQEP7_01110 [bacterium]
MKYAHQLLVIILLLLVSVLPAGAREVIVVPRAPEKLPRVDLQWSRSPKLERIKTIPDLQPDTAAVDTGDISPQKPLQEPELIANITAGEYLPQPAPGAYERESEGQFYHVTGQVDNMSWARVHLYEQRGGFFEVYDTDEMNRLGSDYLDSEGRFRIGPLEHSGGWFYRGRDVVLVLELDSPYAIAYSEVYGVEQPYRFQLATRRRVVPRQGSYEMGRINIDWEKSQYYPARAYRRVIDRLREQGIDQKIKVEFTRDVDEPRYMERIGYVLMPYRE